MRFERLVAIALFVCAGSAFAGMVPTADISVTKSGLPNPATAGSNVTYTIVVSNAGPDAASSVSLSDTIPPGTTFVSFTQTSGPAFMVSGGTTSTATIASLPAAASATFALTVHIPSSMPGGSISNTATVTDTTFDPNPGNNSAFSGVEVGVLDDLSVVKTDSPDPVSAGTDLTYQLTFSNAGPSDATSPALSDPLPANTTFVSMVQNSGPTFSVSNIAGTVTANAATLAAGATATFTLVVHVNASTPNGTTITNTATGSAISPDADSANDSSTTTTTVAASADLVLTKTDSPDPVNQGANITYTLTLTNNGPSDAQSVSLNDGIPIGTTLVSFVQNTGPAFIVFPLPLTVNATAATLPAGASATFTLVVNVGAATTGTISNTANVSSTTADPNGANNTSTANTVVNTADLAVAKSDTPDPVAAGSNINYTLTLTNNGPASASTVVLSDNTPANTTFVSMTQVSGPAFTLSAPAAGGTGLVTASAATLAAGGSAVFTLVLHVNAATPNGSTITNTASVSTTTTDPVPGNNSATATTTVNAAADLSLTKTDSPDPVTAGTNITYALTLTNNGPADAQSVSLTDAVPANTTFVSMVQNSGPAFTVITGPATETATIATLASGASATFTLVVTVNAASGTITNTANVTSTTPDGVPGNNASTATTTITPVTADLGITKTNGSGLTTPGSNVTYTITVTNGGPAAATGVTVVDTLPVGVNFVSATPSQGTCSGTGPVTCGLGTIVNGATATISLVVQSTASPGTVTNTATVSSATTDPNPANNTAVSVFTAIIPTLSEWMLLLLALALGAVGFVMKE